MSITQVIPTYTSVSGLFHVSVGDAVLFEWLYWEECSAVWKVASFCFSNIGHLNHLDLGFKPELCCAKQMALPGCRLSSHASTCPLCKGHTPSWSLCYLVQGMLLTVFCLRN